MPRYPFCHWVRTTQDRTDHKAPLPITRKINLVGQTKPSFGEEIRGYNNLAYKRSKKTKIIFIDKTDHKLAIHRIPANIPQKVITSNRSLRTSRRTLYWISKRDKKPSRYYLRTHRSVVSYSHIVGGATRMMKNPSMIVAPSSRMPEKASRLDLMVLELAVAGIVVRWLP